MKNKTIYRLLLNNKKGISDEMFFNIFEIVLAFIVILSLFNFVSGVVKQTIFEKNYLARDASALVNTIYAAPGDLEYTYYENAKGNTFLFNFMQNKIEIYEPQETDSSSRVFYLFAEDKNTPFKYLTIKNDKGNINLKFKKTNDIIVYNSLTLPDVEGKMGGAGASGILEK